MAKYIALLLSVLLLFTMMPLVSVAQSQTAVSSPLTPKEQLVNERGQVVFTDSLVETAVRALLGVPEDPLTPKQLAGMGASGETLQIAAAYHVTVDLSVLQLCTKLKSLQLEMVTPADPRAISALSNLQSLMIWETELSDFAFLTSCKKLTNIYIGGTECRNITFAAELPKLSNISIGNYVPDLAPLYACRKLAAVTISAATDAEVNALLDAIGNQLTDLGLNGCAITDATLTRIAWLRLQGLMLDSAHVSSLAPVWNSKTLQQLELTNMHIDTLEGIQNMQSLREISFGGIKGLADYSPLFQSAKLQSLRLMQVEAPNLQGIQNLKKLNQFTLEYIVGAVNLAPVFAMPKLKSLSLNRVSVSTLSGIESMKSLTELSLYKVSGITDYTPLYGLAKLHALYTDVARVLPEGLPLK